MDSRPDTGVFSQTLNSKGNAAWILLAMLILLAHLAGCQPEAEISSYSSPKPPPPVRPGGPSKDEVQALTTVPGSGQSEPARILGAIIPRKEQTWFFKVTGAPNTVAEQMGSFVQFLRSLEFGEEETPRWTLPEGWKQTPGNAFRFATLVIPAEPSPLELAVSALPNSGDSLEEYLLANINRWRDQVQLEPLTREELVKRTVSVDVAGGRAWLVNLEGRMAASGPGMGMGRPPMAGRRPEAPSSASSSGTQPPPDPSRLPFTFELPEGWKSKAAGPMRLAEFEVRDGATQVVASVSTAGGDLLANVNRWRGQVQLEPVSATEFEKQVQKLPMGSLTGDYVVLVGPEEASPRQTILGVVVSAQGRQWFIKLQGDAALAAREQAHFEAFAQSIRFRAPEGDDNGQ